MTELEMVIKENEKLKKLLIQNGILEDDKSKAFSSIKSSYLNDLKIIEKNILDKNRFDNWFNNNFEISENVELFLKELLEKYSKFISEYNEDTLKLYLLELFYLK